MFAAFVALLMVILWIASTFGVLALIILALGGLLAWVYSDQDDGLVP